MDILGTIKAVATVASTWMGRAWGSQTREQSNLEDDAAHAAYEWAAALTRLKKSTTPDDIVATVAALNHWDAELQRLRREAQAKYP